MPRLRHLFLYWSCLLPLLAQAADSLPPPVAAALARSGVPASAAAVWVQALDAPRPRVAHNAERPQNPASVMKLLTAWAALENLGPQASWTTRVAADAVPSPQDRLAGNLYLVGSGDPVLSQERLGRLLRQIRGMGVKTIGGDLILDPGIFPLPPFDPGAFDGRGDRPYNAGPAGLILNFTALRITLVTQPGSPRPWLMADPPLAGLSLENRVSQEPGPCEAWHRQLVARLEPKREGGQNLVVEGRWRTDCGRRDWNLSPLPPEAFNPALVEALWRELGGELEGRVRLGSTPPQAMTLLEDRSPPLAEVVRDMNKWSNNLIARQLLLTLGQGAAEPGEDLTTAGIRVVNDSLARTGIDTRGLIMENGAGLSRSARVRTTTVGQVLLAAWRSPFMAEFMAALPVAGRDGTARRRLEGSPAAGYAHLKTGSLEGVVSMAGYVLDRQGRRHGVVMVVNHPNADASREAQDALVEWVWAGSPRP
ncbi:MAG: D-alanyl-D-alanine carboxypeptidase/D-alanyl-D-alanine-endopeptidase [Rhodocyclaceae bacterium]|nr:D-alanyl-D-alanine carboxypeptidase/D-alanyl-D-alanine-endopeptidase [Rhodocyclaceae bacterium]